MTQLKLFQKMASYEEDFFFPESCKFSWTGNDDAGRDKEGTHLNIERLLNKQHGVQFDPANKASKFQNVTDRQRVTIDYLPMLFCPISDIIIMHFFFSASGGKIGSV